MDILRKILGMEDTDTKNDPDESRRKSEENHKGWFNENDLPQNKTFGFTMFTNPNDLQQHLEQQIEEMMKLFGEDEENFKTFDRDEFFKARPEFKQHYEDFQQQRKTEDTDLDGKAYAEQLKVLLDRIAPEKESIQKMTPAKRTDEEQVMDRIHDTYQEPQPLIKARPRRRAVASPHHIPNGVFDGNGPRVFGQSIISQTVRRPDGSIETRRTVRDSEGHTKTTITRQENGQTVQQITTYDDTPAESRGRIETQPSQEFVVPLDKNLTVTREGYSVPRNLW